MSTATDTATAVRCVVIAVCAASVVGLSLVAVENAFGIDRWWRLALNQVPISYTMHRVLRWASEEPA